MAKKEHELNRWLRRKRTTKTKMAEEMETSTSTISKHTAGKRVSNNMLKKYQWYGVPESIIKKMEKQGV